MAVKYLNASKHAKGRAYLIESQGVLHLTCRSLEPFGTLEKIGSSFATILCEFRGFPTPNTNLPSQQFIKLHLWVVRKKSCEPGLRRRRVSQEQQERNRRSLSFKGERFL
jgi:hypothetical protein